MPIQSMKTKWVTYKKYSGYVVRGGPAFDQPVNAARHIDRAVYLSGQLEAANWGTVQGYDGAGMSGGILHNTSVNPKDMSQGSFFTLLARVFAGTADMIKDGVVAGLLAAGWHVAPDGVLRDANGKAVSGKAIRNEFSGPEGVVPQSGPASVKAQKWAENFFKLFANPATWAAQSSYAAEWLVGGNKTSEKAVYDHFMIGPKLDSVISLPAANLPPEVELAMCMYHAFSVNAPGIATKCLDPFISKLPTLTAAGFAAALIKALGTRKYGNWTDSPGDGSNRYDRTRKAVWARPDLWPTEMAKNLMPTDL